ncbi:MAG: response regulator [Polyangiaceae bacterium]
MRILHVEDDDAHAEITRRILAADDPNRARLIHVSDGQQALDYFEACRAHAQSANHEDQLPDLVLLDLRLPKVDGLEVLRRLKAAPDTKTIPVVILSTSEAATDRAAAYEGGASSYLTKPAELRLFVDMVASFAGYWVTWNRYAHD